MSVAHVKKDENKPYKYSSFIHPHVIQFLYMTLLSVDTKDDSLRNVNGVQ